MAISAKAINIVSNMQVSSLSDKTRVSFDLSKNIEHFIHYDPDHTQITLSFKNSLTKRKISKKLDTQNIIQIYSRQKSKKLLIVFDVLEKVRIKSFVIEVQKNKKYQLIIDFHFNQKLTEGVYASNTIDIMIDPGHGGEDSGAIGVLGIKEKRITLAIAKKVAALFNQKSNINAHLTRYADEYTSLSDRVKKSAAIKADLYLSIHADKYKDSKVSGTSVYILSNTKNSSTMSGWLEKLEVDSDFLSDEKTKYGSDDAVQTVLLDLANKANKSHSKGLAKALLTQLKGAVKLHSKKVQKARFYVLRHSNIPAILIEVGFISNKQEERKLRTEQHQNKLAEKIFLATYQYIKTLKNNIK